MLYSFLDDPDIQARLLRRVYPHQIQALTTQLAEIATLQQRYESVKQYQGFFNGGTATPSIAQLPTQIRQAQQRARGTLYTLPAPPHPTTPDETVAESHQVGRVPISYPPLLTWLEKLNAESTSEVDTTNVGQDLVILSIAGRCLFDYLPFRRRTYTRYGVRYVTLTDNAEGVWQDLTALVHQCLMGHTYEQVFVGLRQMEDNAARQREFRQGETLLAKIVDNDTYWSLRQDVRFYPMADREGFYPQTVTLYLYLPPT